MKLRVGVIGAGDLVEKVHLPVLTAMPQVNVAWLGDVRLQRAATVAKAFGIEAVDLSAGPDRMPPADLALLAIPYGARPSYYPVLEKMGTAVYAEKPFARSAAEHAGICSEFPAHALAVGFQRRSWGPTLLVRDALSSQLFGPLEEIRFGIGRRGHLRAGGHHANFAMVGGGILFEVGIHGLDAALFASAAVTARVDEVDMEMDGLFDIHTAADVIVKTERGETVRLRLMATALEDSSEMMEFHCQRAVISYSLFGDGQVIVMPRQGKSAFELKPADLRPYPMTPFQAFYNHWKLFVDSITAKQANWTSAQDTRLTTEVIEGLYREGAGQ